MFHEFHISIPGTDRFVTTDRDAATVAQVPDSDEVRAEIADRTGVTSFFETETGEERRREADEAEGFLQRFDVAVATGADFVLDHPDRSVQSGVRGILGRATDLDDEELAERAQEIDEGVTESIDERVEGTVFDHRGTDAVRWIGDTLIGEGVRVFTGAATGIDTRDGDLDARTGALEVADIGLTIGTAGVGRAGIGALRAARAGDGVSTTFRAGDTGVARAAEATTPAARTSDDLLPVLHRSEIESALTAATRATDDVAGVVGTAGTRAARTSDDLGAVATRLSDDIGQVVARASERLGIVGSRIGAGTRAAATGRPAQFAAAGTALGAGVVGGGALINELSSRYEMADGTVLIQTDTFQPTDRFDGGILYRVKEEDGPTVGYSVVVGQQGRNIIMLGRDGQPTRAPLDVDELSARARGGQ